MAEQQKRPKTGGRTAGTPNKATAEVKAVAQKHTQECIDLLMSIGRDKKEIAIARVAALREVLNRGHGRATEHKVLEGKLTMEQLVLGKVDGAE